MDYKYIRKINYYETDQMGIVHHSNYFRFFEEARINYLEENGYSYDRLEKEGIISPVVSISCDYLKPLYFNDIVEIKIKFITSTGTKFEIEYQIYRNNELVTTGFSKHCYLNSDGKIVNIKKVNMEFFNTINKTKIEKEV